MQFLQKGLLILGLIRTSSHERGIAVFNEEELLHGSGCSSIVAPSFLGTSTATVETVLLGRA